MARVEMQQGRLTVVGELDVDVADTVVALGLSAVQHANPALIIDLSACTFIDARGIDSLVEIRNAAQERGVRVYLLGPSKKVSRLLKITGLSASFPAPPNSLPA
jgi:anti-sigma B factor antagonist